MQGSSETVAIPWRRQASAPAEREGSDAQRSSSGEAMRAGESCDPEREALAALDRGDADGALAVLMDAYEALVFRHCCQVMKNRHLAEEVLQETFIRAHRGFEGFARRSTLRTWLLRIAHNRCLDTLKKENNQTTRVQPMGDLPDAADEKPGPYRALAAQELSEALRDCLEDLPLKSRTAVLLRFREELTYPEMSEVCGEREPTLHARVSRALPLLRECVERSGHEL
jgi:RNA polymerase sigma-70 factor (ECF subfamily)